MSAEVANRGCAGVGPNAAACSDVFENVDTLVCEPIELSVVCTIEVQC